MNQKYNIGWYKLAEFVWGKKKEQAIAIFKLLSHSLKDKSLALQLEGDILLSFNDKKAIDVYSKAAKLYHNENKPIHALAIYEHLNKLDPKNLVYYLEKLDLNIQINKQANIELNIKEILDLTKEEKLETFLNQILANKDNGKVLMEIFESYRYLV